MEKICNMMRLPSMVKTLTQQKPNAALSLIADGHVGSQMCNVIKMKELKSVINEFCEMEACPEWDLKYLKQVEDGETKNGPHPGA
ncbi:hypothetical protein T4A_9417 [Trichinella pseudospiralis]|uniref:Uncharacterized protein n=1 Tax=Trichinella pseudospiralis TaxID=6337 RepID=A0A0V1EEQ1_TRIPS|nr:hypothetical protein T4A_9417 [Trichinella pseudospiralis]